MVRLERFERSTNRLKAECSTPELQAHVYLVLAPHSALPRESFVHRPSGLVPELQAHAFLFNTQIKQKGGSCLCKKHKHHKYIIVKRAFKTDK